MSSIQNPHTLYNPVFKSNYKTIKDEDGYVVNRNSTNFFRGDLNWNDLKDYLAKKYAHTDKVNVICYGCSDVSEPVSLAMILDGKLKDDSDKFFPIISKDKDENILNDAKTFKIDVFPEDISQIESIMGNKKEKYLEETWTKTDKLQYSVNKVLKDKIKYGQADILEDIHNIPSKDSVVFCRNFWPYLDNQERELLARRLSNRLKDNCMLVIGDYDRKFGTESILESVGFKETSVENVFVKTEAMHHCINPLYRNI